MEAEADMVAQNIKEQREEAAVLKNGQYPDGKIWIKLRNLAFDAGGTITGVVYADLDKKFKADKLEIDFFGFEYSKFQVNNYAHRGMLDSENTRTIKEQACTIVKFDKSI